MPLHPFCYLFMSTYGKTDFCVNPLPILSVRVISCLFCLVQLLSAKVLLWVQVNFRRPSVNILLVQMYVPLVQAK